MNIPKHIRKAILECAEAFETAREKDELIRNWMEKRGLVDEDFNDLVEYLNTTDNFIDSVELTNNPDKFIHYLEHL